MILFKANIFVDQPVLKVQFVLLFVRTAVFVRSDDIGECIPIWAFP